MNKPFPNSVIGNNVLTQPLSLSLRGQSKRLIDRPDVYLYPDARRLFQTVQLPNNGCPQTVARRDIKACVDDLELLEVAGDRDATVFPSIGVVDSVLGRISAQTEGGVYRVYVQSPNAPEKTTHVLMHFREHWHVTTHEVKGHAYIAGGYLLSLA